MRRGTWCRPTTSISAWLVVSAAIIEALDELKLEYPKVTGKALKELKEYERALKAEAKSETEPALALPRASSATKTPIPHAVNAEFTLIREPGTATKAVAMSFRRDIRAMTRGTAKVLLRRCPHALQNSRWAPAP